MQEFQAGQKVRLLFDVVSDGTVYGIKRGDLVVKAGSVGYVKQNGTFLDNVVVDVHFTDIDRIVGCREHELLDGDTPYEPSLYAKKDKVSATVDLKSKGEVVVPKDEEGHILDVNYSDDHGYFYEVEFDNGYTAIVLSQQIQRLEEKV